MSVIKIHDFKIGYTEAGQTGDKTALVFLHGVGSDKTVWQNQLAYFGKTRRTIAFDYPGYGESDLALHNLTRAEIAEYLIAGLKWLEIEKANVCGLSMGGVIALEIYKQQPELIESLILCNTFAKHPTGREIVERSAQLLENRTMREFAEQRVGALLAPNTSDEVRQTTIETMAQIDKRTYAWSSPAVWTADYLELLPKINVPTLIIGGALDQPTPPALSIELANKIPHAQLEIIENAAHLSNLDQPEIFNRLIAKFIH